MASPAALIALLEALQAERARRSRTADDDAERLISELREMGQRLLATEVPRRVLPSGVVVPQRGLALAEELLQAADDGARLDEIRIREDLAIKDARAFLIAMRRLGVGFDRSASSMSRACSRASGRRTSSARIGRSASGSRSFNLWNDCVGKAATEGPKFLGTLINRGGALQR
jgi:hypothetical protein